MLEKAGSRFLMIALLLIAGLVVVLGAIIAPAGDEPLGGSPTGVTPARGGTWIDDLFGEPSSLIPNASSSTFASMIDQALYTPLFVGDANSTIHPALARELPTVANGGISPDLKTWTFHLRKGVVWNDGQPLDARDVAYSVKVWNDPKFGAAFTTGFNLITDTRVSDDNLSITFTLSRPYAPFLSIWVDGSFAPLPMHHFQDMAADAITKSPDNLAPSVTSGPFMIKESRAGDHYTLVRNPRYWLPDRPYLDSVVFRIVPDQNAILRDLQSGFVDSAWFLDVSKVPAYRRLSNYTLAYARDTNNFEALYFNFNNQILGKHREVRQAIAMAVDTKALIERARLGLATPLCTDHGPGSHPGYQPAASCPRFDLDAANKLLDEYGWKMGPDRVRTRNGQRLEFVYATTEDNRWRADDQLINQQNFARIGIKVDIHNYPADTFFGSFLIEGRPGTYDIAEFENSHAYDPDDAALLACDQIPPNGFNIDFYCNHHLDDLYRQEQQTVDADARQQIFNQIHQLYLTEFPFFVLYAPYDIALVKRGTHNYSPAPAGASETINIWDWWCDDGKCPA